MDVEAQAVDSPVPRVAGHIRQYLDSDGADVDHPFAGSLVLLYTTGRTTGEVRRVPLVHLPDGDGLLVLASKGGAPDHPEWYLNLVAEPRVWVRRKAELFEGVAVPLEPDERAAVWPRLVGAFPFFADYQAKTDRVIPVVRITPTG